MSEVRKVREALHETIQGTIAIDEGLPEGAMLLGWCAVAEWMAPDGQRWLSVVDGDARGEGAPIWQRQGYLHNALFDAENFIPDDEEGEDDGDPS